MKITRKGGGVRGLRAFKHHSVPTLDHESLDVILRCSQLAPLCAGSEYLAGSHGQGRMVEKTQWVLSELLMSQPLQRCPPTPSAEGSLGSCFMPCSSPGPSEHVLDVTAVSWRKGNSAKNSPTSMTAILPQHLVCSGSRCFPYVEQRATCALLNCLCPLRP